MEIPVGQLKRGLYSMGRDELELLALSIITLERKDRDPFNKYREKYFGRPLDWVNDFVDIKLDRTMRRALQAIQSGKRNIAFRGLHGVGKTVLSSLIILWAGSTAWDGKVVSTASAWRQLTKYLWPEVHKWHNRTNWERIGFRPELLNLEAKFSDTSIAFAVACADPATIEGAHAERVVYVYDEAKAIPPATWEATEGAFSTPGPHIRLACSTPGAPEGVFYAICSRKPGYEDWTQFRVSLREAIRSGRVSLDWARKCRKAWGEKNPVYLNRVWGEFASQGEDSIIPLAWVEAAVARWYAWREAGEKLEGLKILGVDVSRGGADRMAQARRVGKVIPEITYYTKSQTADTMASTGRIKNAMGSDYRARVDVIGVGAGVVDRLRELVGWERVTAINAAEATKLTDRSGELKFKNVRAAMWWNARELLDPANREDIALPDDPEMIGDLCAPRWRTISNGAVLIEDKDSIKKRLGRSTDAGDAVVEALFDGEDTDQDFLWVG